MAEVITTRKPKLPEFAAYPANHAKLKEILQPVPVDSMELSFFNWESDTSKIGWRKTAIEKACGPRIFWCHSDPESAWSIWVFPVRKTIIDQVKVRLEDTGYFTIREWFLKEARLRETSTTWIASWFSVSFDGKNLKFE